MACAVTIVLFAPAAAAAQSAELLPDLVADVPGSPQKPMVERLTDGRDHLLVRFDGAIHNAGRGPLEIRGSRPVNGAMTVTGQRIYRANSSYRDDYTRRPPIRYESTDGHGHWHLMGAARYSLWDHAGAGEVAASAKVGFCLLDSERVDDHGPAGRVYTRSRIQYCREGEPTAAQVYQGISAGWLDLYPGDLPFQWVDVSDVAPGHYRIGAEMDPDDVVIESNEQNNGPALTQPTVTVPGYTAVPLETFTAGAQAITLAAQEYGNPGPPQFRIESQPAHGSLSETGGTPFAAPVVVYTPQAGFAGTDSFTYSAWDPSTPFPLRPKAAAVTVRVASAAAAAKRRPKLLVRLRFSRRGRFLHVRGRATSSGVLRLSVTRRARRLGACRKRARSGRRFACRIKLRRGASLRRARLTATLFVSGKREAVDSFRVPRGARR